MDYIELDVWKYSRELVKKVYLLSDLFPKEELYALTNQVRRCSISIPSNIAEGLGRQSNKETIHFLYISRGSLFELETQLFLAFDLNYISKKQLDAILKQITTSKKLLNGFINYFKSKK
ncbi:four helix bundle protein [Winogradskyella eximia]|uniref:Four helix bundle protein n=1 Tax=Winogradskyella eximia TaxID=262006 RepID=A0A3D9H4R4_9FLAO|nr:four helix bundle protein [Winogradskyella eximia]RED44494.1 four helix bundle protein [Winogradskyella eximia]